MIQFTQTTTDEELQEILSLQKTNLPVNISEEEKRKEGFLTVHHDFDLLKRMHLSWPHTIAKDQDKVVGYALSMHPDFWDDIPILKPMFDAIDSQLGTTSELNSNFMIMGQICVDKLYRKQGIFRKLYETMLANIAPNFSYIITEVDVLNTRSLAAHYAIGFKKLTTHTSNGRNWETIYLK